MSAWEKVQGALMLLALGIVGGLVGGFTVAGLDDPPAPAPFITIPLDKPVPVERQATGYSPGPEAPCQSETCEILPYWNWLIPTGKICVEVRGSVYATQAALQINAATDVDMIPARSNCLGYPRTNVVKLEPGDLGTGTCAYTTTAAGTGWYMAKVRGVNVRVLEAPIIRYNTNSALTKSCFGSAFAAKHVWSHELEHALGLKHTWGLPSNVGAKPPAGSGLTDYSWKYSATTAWDNAEINRRY